MKRNTLLAIALLIIAVCGTLSYFLAISSKQELHFVHSTLLNQYLYAWDRKILQSELNVKTTIVQDPAALGSYIMGQNSADIVEVATILAGIANDYNQKVKIIGTLTKAMNADSVVVVRQDSPITSPRDLKGKTIAIPGLAMTPVVLFREVLKQKYQIEYDQITYLLKPLPTLLTLLDKKQVDAVIVFNVFAFQAQENPEFSVVSDIDEEAKELLGDYPIAAVLASNEDVLKERAQDLKLFLGVLKESNEYAILHKKEIAENLAPEFGLEPDAYEKFAFRVQPSNIFLTQEDKQNILTTLLFAYNQGLVQKRIGMEIFGES